MTVSTSRTLIVAGWAGPPLVLFATLAAGLRRGGAEGDELLHLGMLASLAIYPYCLWIPLSLRGVQPARRAGLSLGVPLATLLVVAMLPDTAQLWWGRPGIYLVHWEGEALDWGMAALDRARALPPCEHSVPELAAGPYGVKPLSMVADPAGGALVLVGAGEFANQTKLVRFLPTGARDATFALERGCVPGSGDLRIGPRGDVALLSLTVRQRGEGPSRVYRMPPGGVSFQALVVPPDVDIVDVQLDAEGRVWALLPDRRQLVELPDMLPSRSPQPPRDLTPLYDGLPQWPRVAAFAFSGREQLLVSLNMDVQDDSERIRLVHYDLTTHRITSVDLPPLPRNAEAVPWRDGSTRVLERRESQVLRLCPDGKSRRLLVSSESMVAGEKSVPELAALSAQAETLVTLSGEAWRGERLRIRPLAGSCER